MRVVLVSANFHPHVGGIERFTEILAAGLGGRGHAVEVVCCRFAGAPLREDRGAFSVTRIPSSYVLDRRIGVPWPAPAPAIVPTLRRALRGADAVHVQDVLYATSVAALLLARRRRVPSVLTQHVAFVPQGNGMLDAVEHTALATLGRSARLATHVACLNEAVAEWVRARWGIEDVRLLPVGVPTPATAGDPAEARRSFGLSPDRFVALFVGRDVVKKGLDLFLAAADPAYDLVAVTDRVGSAPGARFLPFMAHERLEELLGCVDVFVLPSKAEGFPVTIQEALLAGLPVVTPMLPGFERHLGPDDALFVERTAESIRSALLALANDPGLRSRLGERARVAGARSFGVDAFVEAYEQLYAEASSGR
jgi:glycosyltransferase involved in cell wall biosynthesis